MLVLDDTIANIALPTIQRELGVSAAALPWIVSAYVLAFGGLLLFGGRLGDLLGRRRVLRIGIVVFTLASLIGGLAPDGGLLIAARLVQGVGAALAAPNALALIATTFPAGEARNKAVGLYGAMSGLGIVVGLLLGGVLTATVGWRPVFLINVPIGLAVLAGTRALAESERHRGRLDVPGAVTATMGVAALAYGLTRAGEHGWGDAWTLASLAAAVVLLTAFVVVQRRTADPLMPLRVFADRARSGSYAAMLVLGSALMGIFYVVTLHLQQVQGFGAMRTGLAWLPFAVGIVAGTVVGTGVVERAQPRALATAGLSLSAAALASLATLGPETSYTLRLAPAMLAFAFGAGLAFPPLTLATVQGVERSLAGIASALLNTAQQIGAALGLALLTSVALVASDQRFPGAFDLLSGALAEGDTALAARAGEALAHGFGTALAVEAVLLLAAAAVAARTLRAVPAPAAPEL
ncbi:MAG: putative transrane efflux protein [Frankiales bacterium]|jgi:EmrB/QacA subfamily drug resistance transporter|nr:putative transrane efflux protein [Frankiales bacterium]